MRLWERVKVARLAAALVIASALLVTALALAATGKLTAKACTAEGTSNPAGCAKTTAGLEFPYAVAVSADGRSAYVAGAGDNALVSFQRDKHTGRLVPLGCIGDETANPAACAHTAAGLANPNGLAVSPDGKSVYVASDSSTFALTRFKRDRVSGVLTPRDCIGDDDSPAAGCARTSIGLDYPAWVTVSPDGRSVYVGGYETGTFAWFARDKANGRLTFKGCIADPDSNTDGCGQTAKGLDAGTSEHSISVSADGRSLYVSADGDSAITRFKRNRKTGRLTSKGCIAGPTQNPDGCAKTAKGLAGAWAAALSSDGRSLYAVSEEDDAIVRFKRDRKTGALEPKGCIGEAGSNPAGCAKTTPGLKDPGRVVVGSDGRSVYVTGSASNAIAWFKRNPKTGAIEPHGCIASMASNPDSCGQTAQGLGDPYGLAISEDGRSLYATDFLDNAVVNFKRTR